MSFLTGLSNLGQGVVQGQNNAQQFQQRAQQIMQGQMAIDAAKKGLQADAAAFAGIGGPSGGMPPALPGPSGGPAPSPQPMMPGQPSVPNQPPQGAPMPAGAQSPGATATPPPAAGSPAPPPQGGGGPLPGGQQGGIDPTDPQAAVKTVMSIAQEIKSRNPNIDPQTLMMATSKIIDMSKGLAPQLRQGAQVVVQQMRDATSQANTGARVGATMRGQNMQQENVGTRVASNEKIASEHDATSLQRAAQVGEQAMARTQANIQAASQRAAQGTWSKEKLAAYKERAGAAAVKLKTATSRLSALTAAGVKPDDPRVAAATKDITGATSEMDRVNKAAGMNDAPSPQGGSAAQPSPAGGGQRGPATHTLNGKPIWPENGKWVYEDGSEAK